MTKRAGNSIGCKYHRQFTLTAAVQMEHNHDMIAAINHPRAIRIKVNVAFEHPHPLPLMTPQVLSRLRFDGAKLPIGNTPNYGPYFAPVTRNPLIRMTNPARRRSFYTPFPRTPYIDLARAKS